MIGVGTSQGREVVDQGQGGGKKVLSSVTVCVAKVPLVMFSGFPLSRKVIGAREILGKRVVEVFVIPVAVIFQFHQGITVAVTSGIVNVVA